MLQVRLSGCPVEPLIGDGVPKTGGELLPHNIFMYRISLDANVTLYMFVVLMLIVLPPTVSYNRTLLYSETGIAETSHVNDTGVELVPLHST